MLLAACTGGQQGGQPAGHQTAAHQAGQPSIEIKQQMQRLQLLIVQAISLAALPGEASFRQAADLLRRAMSGPEMSAMHHGRSGMMPDAVMKLTHDLGDAAFDLLDTSVQDDTDARWRDRLVMVTLAAAMRLDGVLLGTSSGEFEAAQGRLLAERVVSESVDASLDVSSPYAKAASRLIPALQIL